VTSRAWVNVTLKEESKQSDNIVVKKGFLMFSLLFLGCINGSNLTQPFFKLCFVIKIIHLALLALLCQKPIRLNFKRIKYKRFNKWVGGVEMSENKKKVLHVGNLIIHADNVEIIGGNKKEETEERRQEERPIRDPWSDFLWGRSPREEVIEQEEEKNQN
jgi:hypothetical protein